MEIVPRYKLQFECRSAGRQVEDTLLAKRPADGHLPDTELDEVFEPLVTYIEEKTEDVVRQEIDEQRGREEDKKRDTARERMFSEKRANISEKVVVTINEESTETVNKDIINMLRDLQANGSNIVKEVDYDSEDDYSYPSDTDLLNYSTDDDYWDDCRSRAEVTIAAPFDRFIGKSQRDVTNYINDNNQSSGETVKFLETLLQLRLLRYDYYLSGMLDIAKIWNAKRCGLTLKSGIRKGKLCRRKTYKMGKCRYHYGRGNY